MAINPIYFGGVGIESYGYFQSNQDIGRVGQVSLNRSMTIEVQWVVMHDTVLRVCFSY